MVVARMATEMVLELKYKLKMFGIEIKGPAQMFGDNNSVIISCIALSSVLKEKHLSLAYHRVREACAAGVLNFYYIKSEDNFVDILTKRLSYDAHCALVNPWLFRNPNELIF